MPTRRNRNQRGGWADVTEGGIFPDLQAFYDRYMRKAEAERVRAGGGGGGGAGGNAGAVSPLLLEGAVAFPPGSSNSLIVVDMQPGFTNGFPATKRFGGPGAFSVADGENVVAPMMDFIIKNMASFKKIVLTRDSHDEKHCSFGTFPPHCIINTEGAALIPELEALKEGPDAGKIDVIFKGMNPRVDSFGGVPYHDDEYFATRQVGDCCKVIKGDAVGQTCQDATGGYHLKDLTRRFEQKPFAPEGANTYAEIREQLGDKFSISGLLLGQTSGVHNVFVCGLAGDFCVKDTALNIAKHGSVNGVKLNVYVVQPLTRYPLLPILLEKDSTPYLQLAAKPKDTVKDFNKYIFKYVDGGRKILSVADIQAINASIAAGGSDPLRTDPTYGHFLTNPSGLLADYAGTENLKVLMNIPTFAGAAGGYRRNRNRNYRKTQRKQKQKQQRQQKQKQQRRQTRRS